MNRAKKPMFHAYTLEEARQQNIASFLTIIYLYGVILSLAVLRQTHDFDHGVKIGFILGVSEYFQIKGLIALYKSSRLRKEYKKTNQQIVQVQPQAS